MTTLLAALVLNSLPVMSQAETVILEPEEDVWVYPHAGDPSSDPFLRVWGAGGTAVAKDNGDVENYSYSYLNFNVSKIPNGKKLTKAELILRPAGKPEISSDAKNWPLEVRPLEGAFTEKTWSYDKVSAIKPDAKIVFGTGLIEKAGESFTIKIDLLGEKSSFAEALGKLKETTLNLALTSKFDVSEMGMKGVYKVHSKDNKDVSDRPQLVLRFE